MYKHEVEHNLNEKGSTPNRNKSTRHKPKKFLDVEGHDWSSSTSSQARTKKRNNESPNKHLVHSELDSDFSHSSPVIKKRGRKKNQIMSSQSDMDSMNLTHNDQLSTCSREKPLKQSLELNIYKRNEGNSDRSVKTKRKKPSNMCIDRDGKELLSAIESDHSGLASLQKPKTKRYRIKCDQLNKVLGSDVDHSPVRNVVGEKHEQSPSKQQLQGV